MFFLFEVFCLHDVVLARHGLRNRCCSQMMKGVLVCSRFKHKLSQLFRKFAQDFLGFVS